MRYFTTNQYGELIIADIKHLPELQKGNYTPLTDAQVGFMTNNPAATPLEIMQCALNLPPEPEPIVPDLSSYKEIVRDGISDLSLMTSRKKVRDYQFLNAQSSLLVSDGAGIYSHAQAREYIATYNAIGKQCREYYYSFLESLTSCDTKEQVDALVSMATNYYESL